LIRLGLTGSIGMGKSTAAAMFGDLGDAVIDADAIVHALYRGAAVAPVEAAFPGVTRDGVVDRARLGAAVLGDHEALARLEAIVHPLVRKEEDARIAAALEENRRIAVIDVPLLFETGRAHEMDAVVVVSAPASVQRERVLSRPGMSEGALERILARQMPDAEKRRRAHFVHNTSQPLDVSRIGVAAIRRAVLHLG